MIFRRSLVREMTTTAMGLFLVLLGILFTNLVLKLLARAAGGTVAPEGVLTLLGFGAMFYFNILLSVTLFLTVLLTLTRWYRDSEMIVWFTSGQALTACLPPILWFSLPFLAASVIGLASLTGLYYEEIFNLSESQRGFVAGVAEPAQIVGILLGIPLASRLMLRDPGLGLRLLSIVAVGIAGAWVALALAIDKLVSSGVLADARAGSAVPISAAFSCSTVQSG